jgi:hypothetical protein
MTIIKQIFGQNSHWQINKDFARQFGIETTLLLSDLIDKWIYFECPDWFYNTSENIEIDTTLTRHQQDKAFKVLIENNFIEVDVRGLPAKKHFKILENNILEFYRTILLKTRKQVCKKSANLIDENLQTYNKNKGNENKEDNNKTLLSDLVLLDKHLLLHETKESNAARKKELFEKFWDLYDHKVDRKNSEIKFNKLSFEVIEKIIEVVPLYVKTTTTNTLAPNGLKYRKNPLTWLNGECWNDEIIARSGNTQNADDEYNTKMGIKIGKDGNKIILNNGCLWINHFKYPLRPRPTTRPDYSMHEFQQEIMVHKVKLTKEEIEEIYKLPKP